MLTAAGDPTLWPTIYGWLEMAAQLSFEDASKQAQFSKIDFDAMRIEVGWGGWDKVLLFAFIFERKPGSFDSRK